MYTLSNPNTGFPRRPATDFDGTFLVFAGGASTDVLNSTDRVYVGKLNSAGTFDFIQCAKLPNVTWEATARIIDGYIYVSGTEPLVAGVANPIHVIYSGKMDSRGYVSEWSQFVAPVPRSQVIGVNTAMFMDSGYMYLVNDPVAYRGKVVAGRLSGTWELIGKNPTLAGPDDKAWAYSNGYLYLQDQGGYLVSWKVGNNFNTGWTYYTNPTGLGAWGLGMDANDGKLYMACGQNSTGSANLKGIYVTTLNTVNGAPGTWTRIGTANLARNLPHLHVGGGKLIIAIGEDVTGSTKYTTTEIWNLDYLDRLS